MARDDVAPTESEIERARVAKEDRQAERDCDGDCPHYSYTQDKITGECACDDCGMLLIDSIGRVLT